MKQSLKTASMAALFAMASSTTAIAEQWFECRPVEVAVFASRAHIRCQFSLGESNPLDFGLLLFGDPRFFAVPASDARLTSSTVTLGQAAITSDRSIWVAFDYFDTTGEVYGCRLADCRPIHGLKLEKRIP